MHKKSILNYYFEYLHVFNVNTSIQMFAYINFKVGFLKNESKDNILP